MTDFQQDILVGIVFVTGMLSFISGAFIISAIAFAASATLSNMDLASRLQAE